MKIRLAFVSNSSSSSFIIGIPMSMFGKFNPSFGKYHRDNLNINKFARYIFPNLELVDSIERISSIFKLFPKVPMSKVDAIDEVCSGWFEGCPDNNISYINLEKQYGPKEVHKIWNEKWEHYRMLKREAAIKRCEKLFDKRNLLAVYNLEIDKSDPFFYTISNGELKNVDYILVEK